VKPLVLSDLPSPEEFLRVRESMRRRVIELKARRRAAVGPHVTLLFENRETVRWQVLEMCRVEGHVTEEKRREELDVDNEMLPEDGGLAATMFLELPGEALLKTWLPKLVGIEEHVVLRFGGREVRAGFEAGRSKETTTSCVHYVKFALSDVERRLFASSEVVLAVDHPAYRHQTTLSKATRESLVSDWA
jgi:hypothetical protein